MIQNISDFMNSQLNNELNINNKSYFAIYNECYELLIKTQQYSINEGLLDNVGLWFSNIVETTLKPFKAVRTALKLDEKSDSRSLYEKALEDAAENKRKDLEKNREALLKKKDELKAAAVDAKSAMERNQIRLAHEEMMNAMDAQIKAFKQQAKMWETNKTRLSEDELQQQFAIYDDHIQHLGGDERTKEQKKRDLLQSTLYIHDEKTGEIRLRTAKELEDYCTDNPDITKAFGEALKSDNKKLSDMSDGDIKALAESQCSEIQTRVAQYSSSAINAKEAELKEQRGRYERTRAALEDAEERQKKFDEFDSKVGDAYDTIKNGETHINNNDIWGELGIGDKDSVSDKDIDDAIKAYEKKYNVTFPDDIKTTLKEKNPTNDNKRINGIPDNEDGNKLIEDINKAKDKRVSDAQQFLDDKDTIEQAKKYGYKLNDGKFGAKQPEKPQFKLNDAEISVIKANYGNDVDTDNLDAVSGLLNNENKKIDAAAKDIETTKAENKKQQNKLIAEVKRSLTDTQYGVSADLDSDFADEVDTAVNDYVAGTVNKDGKDGYYDADGKFVEKPPFDDKEARAKWEAGRAKALLAPSKKQKDALEDAANRRIKITTDSEGKTVYLEQTKEDGKWVNGDEKTREEALAIQKAHKKAIKNQGIMKHIKDAYEEGDDLTKLKEKYPELNALSDNEIEDVMDDSEDEEHDADTNDDNNVEGEYTDADETGKDGEEDSDEDDESTATDADGNKLVKKDGKWYKADENGEADTEAGEVDTADVKMQKKKKRVDPRKIWHKKKKKNGAGVTKSYYHKTKNGWESISPKEFKERVMSYKRWKKHHSQTQQNSSLDIKKYLGKYILIENNNINLIDYLKKTMIR